MLFKTTIEAKTYCVAIGSSVDFDKLSAAVMQVEQDYLIPALSQAQYDLINTAYQANTIAGKDLELLKKAQASLAYFVAWHLSIINAITLTDGGNMEPTPGSTSPARMAIIEASQEQFFDIAMNNLDAMIAYLEANKVDFPAWATSDAYTLTKELFINSTSEYEATGIRINKSRSIFMCIRPFISEVEQFTIRPVLGAALFDALKVRIAAGTTTPSDNLLIKQISKALAYLSMLEALPTMNVKVTSQGLQVSQSNTGVTQRSLAQDKAKTQFYEQIHKTGNANLSRLRTFLEEHAVDYPDYVTLEAQAQLGKTNTCIIQQSLDGSIIML